jgi:hypothetical protein
MEWDEDKNLDVTPDQVTVSAHRSVWWRCTEGHQWRAPIYSRTTGNGCPSCATYGFDINLPGVLYFLFNKSLGARKIGITNVGTSRLRDFVRLGWIIIFMVERFEGQHVAAVERKVLRWIRRDLRLPEHLGRVDMGRVGGWTETFSAEGPSDFEVISRIESEFARIDTKT